MPTCASRLTRADKAFSTSSVARNTASRYAANASASWPRAAATSASTRPKSNSRQRSPRTPRAWLAPLVNRLPLDMVVALPNLRRQVPEWWRTFFSPPVAAFLYGAGLGVGFLTYLSFGTLVAVAAVAVASGNPLVGVLVLTPFGMARGLSVLVVRSAATAEGVTRVVDRLDEIAV